MLGRGGVRGRVAGDRSGVVDIICTVALGADRLAHPPLWPEVTQPSLDTPERLLLDQIAAGELDHHLVAIADAIHSRRALLHTVRAATAIPNCASAIPSGSTATSDPATCRASTA